MPRLPADEFKAWNEAFNDAFTTVDDLNSVVYLARTMTLDQLALGGDLVKRVENLIRKADDEGWMEELIAAAHEKRPNHRELTRIYDQVRVLSALEPADHFQAIRLRGQPFVNRGWLREALNRLERASGGPILVIDGDPVSGKTYSSRFISYLAEKRKTFKVAWVDLESFARDERGPVKPATVALSIASQLGLSGMPEPGQEQESTWVRRFCDWLTGALGNSPTNCWVVIDGFSRALVAQGTHDLIEALGRRSYENLPMLRLVLLSYGKREDLEAVVGSGVEYEWIKQIERDELTGGLTKFLGLVYLERQVRRRLPVDQAELRPQVVESVNRVLEKVRDEDPNRLCELRRAVADEIQRINTSANGQIAALVGDD